MTRGARIAIALVIVIALTLLAYKATYTYVPPERLAVAEMIALASTVRTPIAETLQAFDTLEGRMQGLLPEAGSALPNSKGPFEWQLDADGTIRGRSARHGVTLLFATKDKGMTWTCSVTPAEHAPRAGLCAIGGR